MRAYRRLFLSSLALVALGCDRPSAPPSGAASAAAPVASPAASPALSSPATAVPSAAPSASAAAAGKLPDNLSVILLTIDSMRADMPWAGYPRPIAPRLTALEKDSVSYTHAYALSSYTSMSVGGFLSGAYPATLPRDGCFFGTYFKEVLMFPERLQAAGVRTMGIQGHGYFKHGTGLDQGFDVWKLVPGLKWNSQTDENVTGPKMEHMAEEMLGDTANTSGRFFAWFHFLDPHDQYMSHPEVTSWGKKGRDLYDGEIEFTDQQVGKLLDFIAKQPWHDRVAIVVSADHGEAFGEHGIYRHGFEVFQNLVRVPWFIHLPGVPGRRIDVNRSHLDLAPTVLSMLNVKADPPLKGVDLVPELLGQTPPAERDVIVDLPRTSDNDRRRALIRGKYKVIAYSDDVYFQVYDIEADPDEKNDLAKTDKETAKPLIEAYRELSKPITEFKADRCGPMKGTKDKPLGGALCQRPLPSSPCAAGGGVRRGIDGERRLAAGGWRTAARGRQLADGGRRTADGGRRSADGARCTVHGGRQLADGMYERRAIRARRSLGPLTPTTVLQTPPPAAQGEDGRGRASAQKKESPRVGQRAGRGDEIETSRAEKREQRKRRR